MMRDLALTITLLVLAPLALRFPFVGVYLWAWLSLMNPHRLAYGFAQELPFNMIIAGLTLVGCLFSSSALKLKITPLIVLIAIFSVWITLTTLFAPVPEVTTPLWGRNIKTMLLLVMVAALITNQAKLHGLVWIIVISLGYFGLKGGGFMALTGGNYIVFGPAKSMIEDNNSLALALILSLPLINYLRTHTHQRLLKIGLIGLMLLTLAAVIGSYSRGGFIAMAAILIYLWLKGRAKVATAALAITAILTTSYFMPDKYIERISTINELDEDSSFQGRLDAWEVAFRTASERVFGAGFDGPRQDVIWQRYLPEVESRASHSIYFMVMGEHGFIGLGIYLAICLAAWRNLTRVLAITRGRVAQLWAYDLATSLQVSMVGFLVGGAALPMAYYDGFLIIIVMSSCLLRIVGVEQSAISAADPLPEIRGGKLKRLRQNRPALGHARNRNIQSGV